MPSYLLGLSCTCKDALSAHGLLHEFGFVFAFFIQGRAEPLLQPGNRNKPTSTRMRPQTSTKADIRIEKIVKSISKAQ